MDERDVTCVELLCERVKDEDDFKGLDIKLHMPYT